MLRCRATCRIFGGRISTASPSGTCSRTRRVSCSGSRFTITPRTAAQTYAVIRDMPLEWGVGDARHYSDLGFMLLGYIVERVSGEPLDAFLEQNLYRPLGLRSTTFNPKAHGFTEFAATEQGNVYERHMVYDSTFGYRYRGDPTAWNGWRQYVLDGEVDDGNSFYANGGVAGHAGLFPPRRISGCCSTY